MGQLLRDVLFSLFFSLSLSLSVCLSVCLSFPFLLSFCLSLSLSLHVYADQETTRRMSTSDSAGKWRERLDANLFSRFLFEPTGAGIVWHCKHVPIMHIEVRDKLADAMVSADPNLHIFNPSVMFGFHTCTGARRVEQGGKAAEFYSYQQRRHVNYII